MISLALKLNVDVKYRNLLFFLLPVHSCVVCKPMIDNICICVVLNKVYKMYNVAVSSNDSTASTDQRFSTAVPKLANEGHHKPLPYYYFAGVHFLTSPS